MDEATTDATGAEGAAEGRGPQRRPASGTKSERTRTVILETALRLFQDRGYDKTTMRAIAQEAGVSVGNAYYYFASKEHLVQGFYDRIGEQHAEAVQGALDGEKDLGRRIRGVLLAWLDVAEPYHEFATQFFKNAADPESPLSPFSAQSQGPREAAIDLHRRTLAGSDITYAPELAEQLPQLLWLQQMGMVLYWVYDRSPGCTRTRALVERSAPLVARAVAASRFRVVRPLVREISSVLGEFLLSGRAAKRGGGKGAGSKDAASKDAGPKDVGPGTRA
ncbi:TetR family transcriptional regulator [Streptomyces sioyaensis]|uniref:TetR/AcrR family transcriptional regulator n=1 Tax=Streptomyces sioyaensis TaxID=67364 RepID=UPI001F3785D1|nr:TetR family transcriptional regulator [Streptomyces sioyaensis]MCF3177403.1 TetR family transcriptional regulator [Streptomyces sioyaensis]